MNEYDVKEKSEQTYVLLLLQPSSSGWSKDRQSDDVCVHSGRRARFAKNIRKQIMMVRRKLSMQKRKMEAADAKSQDTGGSAGLLCISLDLSLGFAVS